MFSDVTQEEDPLLVVESLKKKKKSQQGTKAPAPTREEDSHGLTTPGRIGREARHFLPAMPVRRRINTCSHRRQHAPGDRNRRSLEGRSHSNEDARQQTSKNRNSKLMSVPEKQES
jgi:hypothetical protein